MEEKTKPVNYLSASKIKTFESCSYLYYGTYILKLPSSQNDGTRKGSIVHNIFELLLSKKHLSKFNKIIKNDTITCVKSIVRLVNIYARKLELSLDEKVLKQLDEMVLVGLKTDFFIKGAKLVSAEYKFEINNENPKYHIKGYIDKIFENKDEILVDDYKSSKKKFEGEEISSNTQGLMYSLAAKKIWPDKKSKVRFIFLQFIEDPLIEIQFSEDTLMGFEHYLEYIQSKIDNFTEKDAKANFAYDKGYPSDGSFGGALMCGRCQKPGELKKDGSPKWHCPMRFAFSYYVIKKNGEFQYSTMKQDVKLKEGESIEKTEYLGCPRFSNFNK
jgi:hypothetical protein